MRPKLDSATINKYWDSNKTKGQFKDPNVIHPETLSKYDTEFIVPSEDPYSQLNERRAQRQTGLDKFGNGLMNMGTSAFTGALESTIGLAYGGLSAIANADPSKLWSNDFTNSVIAPINDWAKNEMPFYYSQAEQDSRNPLKGFIPGTEGSGNFWFDKVLGGAGYTIGSMVVGMGLSKAFQLSKAAALGEETLAATVKDIIEGKIEKGLLDQGRIDLGKQIQVGLIMGHGESTFEARTTHDEMRDNLIRLRASGDPQYAHLTDSRIEELATDAGNTNYLMNLPVTGALDMMLLSKWVNPGSKIAATEYNKIAQETVEGVTKFVDTTAKTPNWKRALLNGTENYFKSFGKEGGQEMSQHAANIASQEFVKQHGIKNTDWFNSITSGLAQGITETLTTKEGWEEGLVGGITGGFFGVAQGSSERATRDANTKAKVDALNNFKWDDLTPRAQSFIAANEALRESEKALKTGDLFEAKNKEHEAFLEFIHPLIKTGGTDILKQKLAMLKQADLKEFNAQFGFKEDENKQHEVVDKLIDKVNSAEKLYDNMTRLFGSFYRNPEDRHLNQLLVDRAYKAGSILDDADIREKKITDELRELGAEGILMDRNAALSNDVDIDPILKKDLQEIGDLTDYDKKRKELKDAYREKYNESVEKLSSVLPTAAPEIKQLLGDLNRLAERRENFINYFNELQDPEKAKLRFTKEALQIANEKVKNQPEAVSSAEDAKEVIAHNDQERQNNFTTTEGQDIDLAKTSDEDLDKLNDSLIEELSNAAQEDPARQGKEAYLAAVQKEQSFRNNKDKILQDYRDKYTSARTVAEKEAIVQEAAQKGFKINVAKHTAEVAKTKKAEEAANKKSEVTQKDAYTNLVFKGENEFKYVSLLDSNNPVYQEIFNTILGDPDYAKKITVVLKPTTKNKYELGSKKRPVNPRLDFQNSEMAVHLAYDGKEFGFVPFYDMFVDKKTGEVIPVASLTEDQFKYYFGEGHNKNFSDFQRTYLNAKGFYEELKKQFDANNKQRTEISNEELTKYASVGLTAGSLNYVEYGKDFPALSTYPVYTDEKGNALIVDTTKIASKTVEVNGEEKKLPNILSPLIDEVYEESVDKEGLVTTKLNSKYESALNYLDRITNSARSGNKIFSRYLALVEQAGGPVVIDGKSYQWVALSPIAVHNNMDNKLNYIQSVASQPNPGEDELARINKELINNNLFVTFGNNQHYDSNFRVSLQPNLKTGGVTVKIYSPSFFKDKQNAGDFKIKNDGTVVYLNIPKSKNFEDFLSKLEKIRKDADDAGVLPNTSSFTANSFKFNPDPQSTERNIVEQFGVTVEPNNKSKHIKLDFVAPTNYDRGRVVVEKKAAETTEATQPVKKVNDEVAQALALLASENQSMPDPTVPTVNKQSAEMEVMEARMAKAMGTTQAPASTDAKANTERKRQEELNQENYRIPVSKETRTWTDEDGTKFETTITTFKDGSKQATNKNLETQGVTPISKYSKELSNEKIYEVEAPNAIERGEIQQQEVKSAKISDKINAKYDAEYIDKVKKGEFTAQQAKDALTEINRLTPELSKQIDDAELASVKGNLVAQDTSIELEVVGDTGKPFLLVVDRKGNINLFSEKQSDGSYKSGNPAPKEAVDKLYNKYVPEKTRTVITNWLNALSGSWAAPETEDGKNYDKAKKALNAELAALEGKPIEPSNKVSRKREPVVKNEPPAGPYKRTTYTPEQRIDLQEAFANLRRILPDSIKAEELSELEAKVNNGIITFGQFQDSVIKLFAGAEKGTEYHEAFHAVFRTLLTQSEQVEYYALAKEDMYKKRINFNKAVAEFLALTPEARDLTKKEIELLVLEEHMANSAQEYAKTERGILGKLWARIKRLYEFFTGNKSLNNLFDRIYTGAYKNAKVIDRFASNFPLNGVNSRIFAGKDINNNDAYLTQQEHVRWVNTVSAAVLSRLERNSDLSVGTLIDEEITKLGEIFDIEDSKWDFLDWDSTDNLSTKESLKRLDSVFHVAEPMQDFRNEVLRNLAKFKLEEDDVFEQESSDSSPERNYDRNQENIGGFGSLSAAVRRYIGTVSYETTLGELLGLPEGTLNEPIQVACDPKHVYNGLAKVCANQETPMQVLEIMGSQIKHGGEMSKFISKFFEDTGLAYRDGVIDVTGVYKGQENLVQRVAEAFHLDKVDYIFTSMDPNSQLNSVFLATKRDSDELQVNNWNNLFLASRLSNDKKAAQIERFIKELQKDKTVPYTEVELDRLVDEYKKVLEQGCLSLSKGYIEYLLLTSIKTPRTPAQDKVVEKFSVSIGMTPAGVIDNLNAISGIYKTTGNPFEKNKTDVGDTGAVTRLLNIAKDNAIFDETVMPTSYTNAEGKPVHTFQKSTHHLSKIREIANSEKWDYDTLVEDAKTDPRKKYFLDNYLLTNPDFQDIRKFLEVSRIDGIRERSLNKDESGQVKTNIDGRETQGVVFGDFNDREFLVTMYNLFTNKKVVIGQDGKAKTLRPVLTTVMAESNTGDVVHLPTKNFVAEDGSIEDSFAEALFKEIQREHNRIKRVQREEYKDRIINFNTDEYAANRGKKFWYDNQVLLDFIAKQTGNSELTQQIIAAENLDEFKDVLQKGIKEYFEADFKDHIELLVKEGVIAKTSDGLASILLPKQYFEESPSKEKVFDTVNLEHNIKQVYLNNYINTLAINQLISDDPALGLKDFTDKFKRDKGENASGMNSQSALRDFTKELRYAIFGKNILGKDGSLKFTDPADPDMDAQGYGTVELFRELYSSFGRMTEYGHKLYDKVDNGLSLTYDEINYLKDNNIMLNSIKMVYYNGTEYVKLSIAPLTKEAHSIRLPNGKYVAQKGKEWLHDLRQNMENSNTHLTGPPSMSKKMIVNPVMMNEDNSLPKIQAGNTHVLDSRYFRLQQENPSNKKEIVDPTQMLQILAAEQDDSVVVNGKTIGEIKEAYNKLLGERVDNSLVPVRAFVSKMQAGERVPDFKQFVKVFRTSLETSGASDKLLAFTEIDAQGQPVYDWNDASVVKKFEEMYTAHFNTAMKQRIPGYKTTAQSDFGHEVIIDKAGNIIPSHTYLANPEKYHTAEYTTRRLKVREDGFAEVILPAHFKELFGLKEGDPIPEEIAKIFATRIPSQDKHSSIPCIIVDFLPAHYGSNIIVPVEFIHLTGSDFDIDSFYCHRPDHYVDKRGNIKLYGNSTDSKWEQFKRWHTDNNSLLKDLVKSFYEEKISDGTEKGKILREKTAALSKAIDLKNSIKNSEDFIILSNNLSEINDEIATLREEIDLMKEALISRALKQLDLPSTEEEYKKNPVKTNGEINNELLDYKIALHSNEHTLKEIAKTSATLDVIEETLDNLATTLGWGKASNMGKKYLTSSMNGLRKAFSSVKAGANAIGAAVNNTQAYSVISKHGLTKTLAKDELPLTVTYGDYSVTLGKVSNSLKDSRVKLGRRIMDILSSLTSSMTDNAKHNFNERLGIDLNSLGPVGVGVMQGIDLQIMINLINTETVNKYISLKSTQNISTADEKKLRASQRENIFSNLIAEILNTGEISREQLDSELLSLNADDLIEALKKSPASAEYQLADSKKKEELKTANSKDVEYLKTNLKALKIYQELEELSEAIINFNKVVKLTKGLVASGDTSTSFAADDELFEALRKMNIEAYESNGEFKLKYIDSDKVLPYDFLPIIRKESLMISNIRAVYEKNQIAKQAFVSKTKLVGDTQTAVIDTFTYKSTPTNRRKALDRFRRGFESHLNILAVRHALTKQNKSFIDFAELLYGEQGAVFQINEFLKRNPEYTQNTFLRSISRKVDEKTGFNKLATNTRGKGNAEFENRISDDFDALGNTTEGRQLQKVLLDYLIAKDGMMFKNESFVKYIRPFYTRGMSDLRKRYLSLLNNPTSTEFKDVFGKTYKELQNEYLKLFFRDRNQFRVLPKLRESNLKDTFATIEENTISINTVGVKEVKADASEVFNKIVDTTEGVTKITFMFPRYFYKSGGEERNVLYELQSVNGVPLSSLDVDVELRGQKAIYKRVDQLGNFDGITTSGKTLEEAESLQTLNKTNLEASKASLAQQDTPGNSQMDEIRSLAALLSEESSVERKTYSGKVTSLKSNQIFVFGSNPEGRHGAGAAKYAKDNFGAIYGQGEGLQGKSYALPTKDLRVKENNSLKSISSENITSNIKRLYDVAKQNPTKEFLISDYSENNLNGYTGEEMATMFINAGPIPSNIVFNENFDKLIEKSQSNTSNTIQAEQSLKEAKLQALTAVHPEDGMLLSRQQMRKAIGEQMAREGKSGEDITLKIAQLFEMTDEQVRDEFIKICKG